MTTTFTAPLPLAGATVTEAEYRTISLGDDEDRWELHEGRLREKPGISVEHGGLMFELGHQLRLQLDPAHFRVRTGHARLRRSSRHYYIPDLAVIPAAAERALRQEPGALDAYTDPIPLVVEIWSPSTGEYDLQEKVLQYQARGDAEIWRLHPYDRTLKIWRRRADGGYDETRHQAGLVRPASLPGVTVDLHPLFAD